MSAQKKRVVTISDSNHSFSSGKAAFFSQMEVLLEFLVFPQHQQCHISVQHCFRRDVHVRFAVSLHAEDIDAVFPADVQLADAVPTPVLRHGDLDDGVLLVQLNVAEDMVGGVAERRAKRPSPINNTVFIVRSFLPLSGSFVCCAAFYCTRYPLAHLSKAYASCGAFPLAQLTAREFRRLRQQQVKAPDPVDLQMQPLRR